MKNETQNQSKSGKGPEMTKYDYDVFVSYRHLSEDSETHSIPLARSITQAFQLEGFKVFFYCNNTEDAFRVIQENKSRYYIILITKDSIETIKKYPYLTIEEIESRGRNENGDGYNFAKEVYLIDKGIEAGEISKKNVLLFNMDKVFKKKRDIKTTLLQHGFKFVGSQDYPWTEVIDFPTDERFTISKMINPDSDKGGEVKIKKSPRFSYERYKRITKSLLIISSCLFFVLAVFLGVNRQLSKKYDNVLRKTDSIQNEIENNCIVFAGGGTAQRYIDSVFRDSISIKNYNIGSKYIHLPSTTAYQLLWDDVNEDSTRQYCPVVLSAGKIDTKGVDIEKFKITRRIAEYQIDSIPLMVQIFDGRAPTKGVITINSLEKMLKDTLYEIWTTSKESGTYLEYKSLLNKYFNLDSIVDCRPGGWKRFNLDGPIGSHDYQKKQIYLANKYYYNIVSAKEMSEFLIISDTITQIIKTEKLYVYTIALLKGKNGGNSSELELLPAAKKFLYRIGCNTAKTRTTSDFDRPDSTGGIIIPWPKREQK